ncbi:MAG: phage/plasmid primase, P4 family, partial [Deltaproteobacteria bacterium]|nr:phage/plasmid primase, P4 family [Deltaproteobacteria bacterium]
MTDKTDDDIRKQVKDRVNQEAAALPSSQGEPEITRQFVRDSLFLNEEGDSILYATLFRDGFVFLKNRQEWFEWRGHVWKRDVMNRATAAVSRIAEIYLNESKKVALDIVDLMAGEQRDAEAVLKLKGRQKDLLKRHSQLRADKRRTACLKFAHNIDNPLAITGDELDDKPMLFPCANGVIDLETGTLNLGRPSDYLSLSSPVEFLDINTPAPLWEKTLLEIFNGNQDLVDYLQRLFGYAMTGLIGEKVFPVLYGRTGWNGRSLIVETISHVMGELARSIPSEMLLSQKFAKSASGPSPDIMSLKGIRMAFASEIDENQRFSAAKVKWLTGKDELVGRSPHDKYPTYFSPTHKLFIMTNTQPSAPPNDSAFWLRLHLIPFFISFVNRDPQESYERRAILDLDRQVLTEAPGILAWLVRGCLLWQKHGLNPPLEITNATEEYRKNEDLLADWIDECCIREPGAKDKAANLYQNFVQWYHDNVGKKEPSGTWFGKQLAQKYEKSKSQGI